jgi:DNA-binding transcriptional ArsR family regulator
MTAAGFNEMIHQSTRLSIMSLLAATDWTEFAFIRDQLELSDSALSKQLSTLEGAGYLTLDHILGQGRRRLRAQLTQAGRTAFQAHVAALQNIVGAGAPAEPVGANAT